jgi:DNA-binding transcriptional ArsR family regulator
MTNHAKAFNALGDPTRRLVFERLAKKPMPVGKLAKGLAVTRPAVSQHLKVLLDAGLVTLREEGTHRIYRINPHGVEVMRAYLDRFWDRNLAAFKAAAEMEPFE